jgi:hypothetical protein
VSIFEALLGGISTDDGDSEIGAGLNFKSPLHAELNAVTLKSDITFDEDAFTATTIQDVPWSAASPNIGDIPQYDGEQWTFTTIEDWRSLSGCTGNTETRTITTATDVRRTVRPGYCLRWLRNVAQSWTQISFAGLSAVGKATIDRYNGVLAVTCVTAELATTVTIYDPTGTVELATGTIYLATETTLTLTEVGGSGITGTIDMTEDPGGVELDGVYCYGYGIVETVTADTITYRGTASEALQAVWYRPTGAIELVFVVPGAFGSSVTTQLLADNGQYFTWRIGEAAFVGFEACAKVVASTHPQVSLRTDSAMARDSITLTTSATWVQAGSGVLPVYETMRFHFGDALEIRNAVAASASNTYLNMIVLAVLV